MIFFPHYISDFNNATRHLSLIERAVYRELLDLYYDSEAPLPNDADRLARRILARSAEERAAVDVVLEEFFTLDGDAWRHERCDAEIARYYEKSRKASDAGKASAASRAQSQLQPTFNDRSTTVQQSFNDGSTNKNREEIKTVRKAEALPCGFDRFWAAYPKRRNRGDAEKAWAKLGPDEPLQTVILQAVEVAKRRDDWRKDGGQFIPYPASWLNRKGWLDEATSPVVDDQKQFRATGERMAAL